MNQQHQSRRMIWSLMLASNALYAAMPLLIPGAEGPVAAVITAALVSSAAMSGLMSFVLPRAIAKLPEGDEQASGSRSLQASIVAWVLAETVALYGVVLFVLGGGTTWLWALCAASAVLLGIHAPREAALASHRSALPHAQETDDLARPDVKIG